MLMKAISSKYRISPFIHLSRLTSFLLLLLVFLCSQISVHADFVDLTPNTTGYFTADTTYAWNNTTGLGDLSTTLIGSTQGLLANKQHRSYLIFDTYQANSAITSGSINFGVSSWTNSRGGLPTYPLSIQAGLPTGGFTAADFASLNPMYTSGTMPLFNALDDNSLGSVQVTVAPNTAPVSGQVVWYTINLPLGFVVAFNQARLNGSRYLTLSVKATDPYMNRAEISQIAPNGTTLRVNTISSTPEPLSMVSLGVGVGLILLKKRMKIRQSGPTNI